MLYPPESTKSKVEVSEFSHLWNLELIQAAQKIYYTYYKLHGENDKSPIGVAIDPNTHRGQVLFTKIPILLPREHFIPLDIIESEAEY